MDTADTTQSEDRQSPVSFCYDAELEHGRYIQVRSDFLCSADFTPTAKVLYLVLSYHSALGDTAWPGCPLLSRECGTTEAGVSEALLQLIRAGLVTEKQPSSHAVRAYFVHRLPISLPELPKAEPITTALHTPRSIHIPQEPHPLLDTIRTDTRSPVQATPTPAMPTLGALDPHNNPPAKPRKPSIDHSTNSRQPSQGQQEQPSLATKSVHSEQEALPKDRQAVHAEAIHQAHQAVQAVRNAARNAERAKQTASASASELRIEIEKTQQEALKEALIARVEKDAQLLVHSVGLTPSSALRLAQLAHARGCSRGYVASVVRYALGTPGIKNPAGCVVELIRRGETRTVAPKRVGSQKETQVSKHRQEAQQGGNQVLDPEKYTSGKYAPLFQRASKPAKLREVEQEGSNGQGSSIGKGEPQEVAGEEEL